MPKKKLLLLFSLLSIVSAGFDVARSEPLPLEPKVVLLEGELLKVAKYGPPNYGEHPESDAKYDIPILLLKYPIQVKEDVADPRNKPALSNVSFVQLIFLDKPSTEYWRYANRDILVTGTLFHAQTGHHYTEVLLTVKTIRTKK
jgi:hypothetical protein